MTKTKLNIESWNRKEHFQFFSTFDDFVPLKIQFCPLSG